MAWERGSGGFGGANKPAATPTSVSSYSMGSGPSDYGPGGRFGGSLASLNYSGNNSNSSLRSSPSVGGVVNAPPPPDYRNAFQSVLSSFTTPISGDTPGLIGSALTSMLPGAGAAQALVGVLQALGIEGEMFDTPGVPLPERITSSSDAQNQLVNAAIKKYGNTASGVTQFKNLLTEAQNYANFERERAQAEAAQRAAFEDAARLRGYGYDDFAQYLDPVLARQSQALQDALDQYLSGPGLLSTSLDPYKFAFDQYYIPGSGVNALNEAEQSLRNQFLAAIDAFAPTGFESTMLPNTFDDPFIDSILNDQYSNAWQQLERALSRGQITPAGFSGGVNQLNEQKTKGNATLQGIGGDFLSMGRQDLLNIANEGRQGASGFKLGGTFDTDQYRSRIDQALSDFTSTLPGKLSSSAGQLIQFQPAYQAAGVAQGAQNPGGAVAAALSQQNAGRNRNSDRGLGTEGAF